MADSADIQRTPEELIRKGVIILDKPAGPTSHEVAAWVKRILHINKAGHSGTLDPKATGVLPILLQDATKAVGALVDCPKNTSVCSICTKWSQRESCLTCQRSLPVCSINVRPLNRPLNVKFVNARFFTSTCSSGKATTPSFKLAVRRGPIFASFVTI